MRTGQRLTGAGEWVSWEKEVWVMNTGRGWALAVQRAARDGAGADPGPKPSRPALHDFVLSLLGRKLKWPKRAKSCQQQDLIKRLCAL